MKIPNPIILMGTFVAYNIQFVETRLFEDFMDKFQNNFTDEEYYQLRILRVQLINWQRDFLDICYKGKM